MKRIPSILLALVLFAGIFIPAVPVSAAADAWNDPGVPEGVTDYGGTHTGGEIAEWIGTFTKTGSTNVSGKYVCVNPGCTLAQDVYVDATVTVVMDPRDIVLPYRMHFELQDGAGNNAVIQEVMCSSGITCTAHVNMIFPAENMILTGLLAGTVKLYFARYGSGSWTRPIYTINVTMSMTPQHLNDCDDVYQAVEVVDDAVAIPVTSETGATTTLEAGSIYRVTVTGLWDDGEENIRNDTAIKQGEDPWMDTGELITNENVLCIQNSIDDPSQVQFVFESLDADWAIRVNDTVGNFGDNTTGTISAPLFKYSIELMEEVPPANCASQYLPGVVLGTVSLDADLMNGENLKTALGMNYPAVGTWYMITVTSGYWQNAGAGEHLQTLAVKHSSSNSWLPIDIATVTGCADETTSSYYLQMTEPDGYMSVRVGDEDGIFVNNTGTLVLTITAVSDFVPFPSGCENEYEIGNLIENTTVQGNWSNGMSIDGEQHGWNPMGGEQSAVVNVRYYMLETYGGPVTIASGDYTWDADLAMREAYAATPQSGQIYWPGVEPVYQDGVYTYSGTDLDWYEIQTAPFVTCVSALDKVGHVRVFFAAEEQIELYEFMQFKFAFRARDTGSYTNNTGSLSYRLYEATQMQVVEPGTVPEIDGCLQFAHDTTALATITLNGSDEEGARVPVTLENGSVYALDVTGGPWYDSGTASYLVEISNDNGDNWSELSDYESLLCSQSADGSHYMIYVQGATGMQWLARVSDGNSNFADNSGTIQLKVYAANSGVDPYPTCDDSYTLTQVALGDNDRSVPGNSEAGSIVPTIVEGKRYSIEITGEAAWYETGSTDPLYLVEISDDGGATWESLEDYDTLCTTMIGNGGRFKIYFDALSSNYKLRVRDGDDDWLTNTGQVMFYLYTAIDHSDPSSYDNTPDPEWVVACNQRYSRPSSLIQMVGIVPVPRVADWIEYGKNAIIFYLAWCPQHTAALANMGEVYLDKEPLASMIYLINLAKAMKAMITAAVDAVGGGEGEGIASMEPSLFSDAQSGLTGDATGGETTMPANAVDLFVVETVDRSDSNPMFGGTLDLTTITGPEEPMGGEENYFLLCNEKFYPLFGIGTDPFCSVMKLFRFTKIMTWVLLVLDIIAALWYLFSYFPGWLKRMWEVITGEKSTIKKYTKKALG